MGLSIRPLGDRVLIKRLEADEKTAGGIVLPDSAKEKPKKGTILSVGEGRLLESGQRKTPQVRKGDKVIFSSYAGTEFKINGEEVLVLDETEILAVIE